ncbi:MAG: S9 family peptidase [Firmicutes bacterium]|nr:S9 family peptidase [Bacillota bacterium]
MSNKPRRLFKIEDMEKIVYVSAPTVAPAGDEVVFVRYSIDSETKAHVPHLYRVSVEGGEARRVLETPADRPLFSPDGSKLAYLSKGRQETQIWLLDRQSGESTQLTRLRHGVSNFVWSPDGRKIAFETKAWQEQDEAEIFLEMTAKEMEQWQWEQENMPRATEELMYKFDETFGFADGSVRQIGIVDLETGSAKLVTDRKHHANTPAWSHDSKVIAYYKFPYSHHQAKRFEIFVTDLTSGETKQVTQDTKFMGSSAPIFTPDNKGIFFAALLAQDKYFVLKLARKSLAGDEVINLFPEKEVCHGVSPAWTGRTEYGAMNPDYQLAGDYIYFTSTWDGQAHLYRLCLTGTPEIEKLTTGEISVRTFCAPVGGKLVYTRGGYEAPDDVFCLDLETRREKRLTDSNEWLAEIVNSKPEEMWIESLDGKARIHGWVIPPAQVEPGKKYPVVLYIHGGPQVSWTAAWWHEFQALAASGHAVVYCDPRGSAGYGHDFVSGAYAWSQEPMDDLMAYVDAALEKYPYLDGGRLGVTGGSYGGYMTVKLVGRLNHRFKAAVGQRILCNPATSYGTGDMGFISSSPSKPRSFKEYIFNRTKGNPITWIDKMKTPFLILHGMLDYRCSAEQAEQLFIAMKERNPEIPVRMVLFPGENHDLTRSGKITAQMRHLDELVNWFVNYLSEGER